ncbi:CaiB/BaiF CoA transferase family protein [Craterilacuibacter sp.]|uniref:CaiB/BaiF CoA transferase family protein n=1 Tax=Craterilacuibacter sp. TaxID=2870909 RepID=UPI003F31DDC6
MSAPLAGVRILDLTQLLPGPMCTLHLADMGAEVIKVEPAKGGDAARGMGQGEFSTLFCMLARNKSSLALDLKTSAGVAVIKQLVESADVLVEGFRPGVMDKLGLSWAALSAINPKLVYCAISGYGQNGARAHLAGHDINYQALAGTLDQNGASGMDPVCGNFPVADLAGGALTAATAILAALFDVARGGKGRYIDVAMADSATVHNVMAQAGAAQTQIAPARGEDYLSGALACYGVYRTADDRHLAVGAVEFKFWQAFCERIERSDLIAQGHVDGAAGCAARAALAGEIARYTLAEWMQKLAGLDACVSAVLSSDEARADARARGVAFDGMHPVFGAYPGFAPPFRISGCDFSVHREAPALGADNARLLAEIGYTPRDAN